MTDAAQNVAKAISSAAAVVEASWSDDGTSFWYRRQNTNGTKYIAVSIPSLSKTDAFDHELVAKELSAKIGKTIDPRSLTFDWIKIKLISGTRNIERYDLEFQFEEKVWMFDSKDGLKASDKEPSHSVLEPTAHEAQSGAGTVKTSVTFVNNLDVTLAYYWVDTNGLPKYYGDVAPKTSKFQRTYEGHVWRLVDPDDNIVDVFRASKVPSRAIVGQWEERSAKSADVPQHTEEKVPEQTAFIKNANVWFKDSDGVEVQLSTNGSDDNPYCDSIFLSADKTFAIVWQFTPAQEHTIHFVESSPHGEVQPRLKSQQYLKPGDRVRIDRPRLFDLKRKCEVETSDELFNNPYDITDLGWSFDDSEYLFLYNERGHKALLVLAITRSGQVRVAIEERSNTFVDHSMKHYCRRLKKSSEILWTSERDGRNHLYLFDTANETCTPFQVTKGDFIFHGVDHYDEEKRLVHFKVLAFHPDQDPYYVHLARINLDGSDFRMLTAGDGTHSWTWSKNRGWFLDSWSKVDVCPKTVVRDGRTGKQIISVEEGSLEPLRQLGWTVPERFNVPGRDDQTQIYGIIIKPSNFDPSKTYPVLENIYAGPHWFHTPKAFSKLEKLHELADLGCIVVQLDGMGTNWRTKAFHDVCFKNLKDAGFPDRIKWIKAAAATRPWMDLSRVGIWGVSAGGQNALGALLFHNHFYKVAVSDCGCHDNRMDKIWWNEQWMGWPVDKSYEDSSNVVHASKLKGKLLLMVGELDTNCDPASTMQVVNALNKADKGYELVFMPGEGHGVAETPYGKRRMHDFFREHLVNA